MSVTNPARLLHNHLSRLLGGRSEQRPSRVVIGTAFGIPPNDDVTLRRVLILVDQLFVATEGRIRSLPRADHHRYLKYFPQLRCGLATIHFESASASAFNFITEAALENLDLVAARLTEDFPEIEIPDEEIGNLEAQIGEVFNFVTSAEFEPHLREVALDLLETLRQAIVEYRIRGVEGLQRAVEEALGKLTLYYKQRQGEVHREAFGRLWALVVRAEAIASKAATYGPLLGEAFQRFLGSG